MRQHSKDEAAWRQTYQALTVEPKEVREERQRARAQGKPVESSARMSVDEAEALLARFAASDALYGS